MLKALFLQGISLHSVTTLLYFHCQALQDSDQQEADIPCRHRNDSTVC